MKKFFLSAAAFAVVAVSAIAVAPNTAEAIPAFSRQTGAACLACHFQAFPAINAFGRAFKMGSFTDVGEQALVEDDGLSIPAVLNATWTLRGNYTSTNTTGLASEGTWTVPADSMLMIAGRIGPITGGFVELGSATLNANTQTTNWQLINSVDLGGFQVGFGAHNSTFGGSGVLELSNVFGQHGGKLGGKNVSAIHAAGFDQGTVGVGTWIGNGLGVVQIALVANNAAANGTVNVGTRFGKLIRAVATLDVAGWDTLIGLGLVTGTAGRGTAAGAVATVGDVAQPMNLQFVDFQMQGDVGDMSVALLADWAHANGKTGVGSATLPNNFYGGGVTNGQDFDAFGVRLEIKPFHSALFGVGYGYNKTSQVAGSLNAESVVKTLHLAATYQIYQNFELNLVFDSARTNAGTIAVPTSTTTRTTVLEFEALM